MGAGKIVLILLLILMLGVTIYGAVLFVKFTVFQELSNKYQMMQRGIAENIKCQARCSVISALGKECNC
jgi:hypothetical protein